MIVRYPPATVHTRPGAFQHALENRKGLQSEIIRLILLMRKMSFIASFLVCTFLLSACSPRDFLTRRLAADLIATSRTFHTPQTFQMTTGVISNKDYTSPEYLVLQQQEWISATRANCPPDLAPSPCWDVTLTPSGVDTFHALIAPADADKPSFRVPAARRELIAITGISKLGRVADVEFTWRWAPLNEVGAALYPGDAHYKSVAGFRCYDDGWRVAQSSPRPSQPLDEALRDAEPAP